ncbi:hypothetical protein P3S68_033006 [Capsicum galapagoense]
MQIDHQLVDIDYLLNLVHQSPNEAAYDQFYRDISLGPVEAHAMSHYIVNVFKFFTEEHSKTRKTNNSGVWVKGDDFVDYFDIIHEILELEYAGFPIKKIDLFLCKWFDPSTRGTRVHKEYNIIEVKHNRSYPVYDSFVLAKNAKQVYYASYSLRNDKSDWWAVIKTKPIGQVKVENVLKTAYQNKMQINHQLVNIDLVDSLNHPKNIFEEVNIAEEEAEWVGDEETFEEGE